ncbi:WRAP73 [Bugula neritina]|uniref:WRAP73 n=1 Tax=Bugula neritina TaxID=10212 RepID=A0A7J7KJC4_BUGNE|nr:WRAP73 [Bugula neritina]
MYLANAVQYKLIVRDYSTLQIVNLFTNLDAIQNIEWSPDSQFVMCVMKKRGLIQVWSLAEPDWTCKIDEGQQGYRQRDGVQTAGIYSPRLSSFCV